MDFDFSNIINAITETYNQLSEWANSLSTPIGFISGIVTILGGGGLLGYFKHRNDVKKWRRNEISKLGDIIDDKALKLIKSKKYISTMGQIEPPHDDESIYISPGRFSLLDKLIDDFKSNNVSIEKKRYIIMGGSGMGKSTFTAALFYKYIQSVKKRKFTSPIYIKSLGNANAIDDIKTFGGEHSQPSILILDALDENVEATKDVVSFMEKLDIASRNFRTVIITCRTQFFKDKESEPNKLNINITGASKRTLSYERIYLSPFTEKEAKRYLRRKFGIWNIRKYYKSVHIAEKCWDVLSRPMVLSFIEDLMDIDNIKDITQVEIYSKIIDKWFDREIEIQNIEITKLYSFSEKIALFMYDKVHLSSSASLDANEYQIFLKENGFETSPYSFNARSLMNRRDDGEIKFSHKSIWEYFLAINSFKNIDKQFERHGLDTATEFVNDLCYLQFSKNESLSNILHQDVHYKFPYSSPSFTDVYESFIYHAEQNSKSSLEANEDLINDFWIRSLYSILYIDFFVEYSNKRYYSDNPKKSAFVFNEQNMNKTIAEFIYKKNELDCFIVEGIQSSFLELKATNLQTFVNHIEQLYKEYEDMVQLMEKNSIYVHHFPLKNFVVFPSFASDSRLEKTFIMNQEHGITIGCGFSQGLEDTLNSIVDYIESIQYNFQSKLIKVLINDDNIDKIACFIKEFGTIDMRAFSIVLYITCGQKRFIYFICELNRIKELEDIKRILTNMYDCSKGKETFIKILTDFYDDYYWFPNGINIYSM